MAKNYLLTFGATAMSGLAPTFLVFRVQPGGGATTAPAISEIAPSTGLYQFSWEPTGTIAFIVDGATVGLVTPSRYIFGNLDPIQSVDETTTGLGASLNAIATGITALAAGNTAAFSILGTTSSSFGSTAADPTTIMGYLKRQLEFNEGDSIFTKTSGLWQVFARGNTVGTSTQLFQHSIVDSGSVITKS